MLDAMAMTVRVDMDGDVRVAMSAAVGVDGDIYDAIDDVHHHVTIRGCKEMLIAVSIHCS